MQNSVQSLLLVLQVQCSTSDKNQSELTLADMAIVAFDDEVSSVSKYMDTRLFLPAPNFCKRLNSKGKRAVPDHRKSISPVHLENQMFCH